MPNLTKLVTTVCLVLAVAALGACSLWPSKAEDDAACDYLVVTAYHAAIAGNLDYSPIPGSKDQVLVEGAFQHTLSLPDFKQKGAPPGLSALAQRFTQTNNPTQTVRFPFDATHLSASERAKLDTFIQQSQASRLSTIRITGHTDALGSAGYNQRLSWRRAEAVRRYLEAHGVDRQSITTLGLGETNPAASNATESGRALNRRAELNPEP